MGYNESAHVVKVGKKPLMFQIYRHPLEEDKSFGGFNDFVQNFSLERGKQDDEEDDNVVGEFKVTNNYFTRWGYRGIKMCLWTT